MREIFVPFASTVNQHSVRVIGHERCDGVWEGVIEFRSEAARLVTGVESTHSSAESFETWAESLKPVYLEGALHRARRPGSRRDRRQPRAEV